MVAPSFVGTATTLSNVSGSGNTIATPTGTVVGESLIAVVRGRIGATGNGAATEHFTLTGFTEVVSSVEASGQDKITMLAKVADATDETGTTYTLATSDAGLDPVSAYVWLARVDQVITVDQVDGTATEGTTSWTIPTLTPTAGDTLAVVAMGPASASAATLTATSVLIESTSGGGAGVDPFVTGSFTPTANTRLYASVSSIDVDNFSDHLPAYSLSGGGLTWVEVPDSYQEFDQSSAYDLSTTVWYADVGGSPSAMTVTVDKFPAVSQDAWFGIAILEVDGAHTITQTDIDRANSDELTITRTGTPTGPQLVFWHGDTSDDTNPPGWDTLDETGFTRTDSSTAGKIPSDVWLGAAATLTSLTHGQFGGSGTGNITAAWIELAPALVGDPPPSPWADIDNVPSGIWVGSIEQAGTAAIGGQSWSGLASNDFYKGIVANFVPDAGGGPTDTTGAPTVVVSVSAQGQAGGQADPTGSPSVVTSVSAEGQAAGTTATTGTPSTVTTVSATGQPAGQADPTGSPSVVSSVSATGAASGAADPTGTPTIVTAVSATGQASAQADPTGTASVVTSVSAEGQAAAATPTTGTPTVIVAVSATGQATAEADPTGTPSVVTSVSAEGDASSATPTTGTPTVIVTASATGSAAGQADPTGTPSIITTVSAEGQTTGEADPTGTPTVVVSVSATGEALAATGTTGTPTVVATVSAEGQAAGQADTTGTPTVVVSVSATGQTSATTPTTGTPSVVVSVSATGTAAATADTTGTPTVVVSVSAEGQATAADLANGTPTIIVTVSATGAATAQADTTGTPTIIVTVSATGQLTTAATHPYTITIRDTGHTATIRDTGHTATIRETH